MQGSFSSGIPSSSHRSKRERSSETSWVPPHRGFGYPSGSREARQGHRDRRRCDRPAGARKGPSTPIGDGIVVLRRVHRFGAEIARLAFGEAGDDVRRARSPERADGTGLTWIERRNEDRRRCDTLPWTQVAVMLRAAKSGEAGEAISALEFLSPSLRSPKRSRRSARHGHHNRALAHRRNRRFRARKRAGTSVVLCSSRPTTTASGCTTATPGWS